MNKKRDVQRRRREERQNATSASSQEFRRPLTVRNMRARQLEHEVESQILAEMERASQTPTVDEVPVTAPPFSSQGARAHRRQKKRLRRARLNKMFREIRAAAAPAQSPLQDVAGAIPNASTQPLSIE